MGRQRSRARQANDEAFVNDVRRAAGRERIHVCTKQGIVEILSRWLLCLISFLFGRVGSCCVLGLFLFLFFSLLPFELGCLRCGWGGGGDGEESEELGSLQNLVERGGEEGMRRRKKTRGEGRG